MFVVVSSQSLTLRKAKAEQMWNIYVLKLKSSTSLFQQFVSTFKMEKTFPLASFRDRGENIFKCV